MSIRHFATCSTTIKTFAVGGFLWSCNLDHASVLIPKLLLRPSTWITPYSRYAQPLAIWLLALCTRSHASNTVHALQDGQEFLKLLLSLLETKLAESGQPVRFVTCAVSRHKFVMHDLFGWFAVHSVWRIFSA